MAITYLYQLLPTCNENTIRTLFTKKFPNLEELAEDIPNYFKYFNSIKEHTTNQYKLVVTEQDIYALDKKPNPKILTDHVSIASMGWIDLLDAEVDQESLKTLGKDFFVVDIFWEMTFYGPDNKFCEFMGRKCDKFSNLIQMPDYIPNVSEK